MMVGSWLLLQMPQQAPGVAATNRLLLLAKSSRRRATPHFRAEEERELPTGDEVKGMMRDMQDVCMHVRSSRIFKRDDGCYDMIRNGGLYLAGSTCVFLSVPSYQRASFTSSIGGKVGKAGDLLYA